MEASNKNTNLLIATILILVAAVSYRLAILSADTPPGLSWSAGLYVDEGYKTLTPRNLLLYGDSKWHEADTYGGWLDSSPITQWSVYAAFKMFGISIESARLVPLVFFTLLLLLYITLYRKRYSKNLLLLGLALLATDVTILAFSHVMLLEMPLAFFFYVIVLPATLYYEKRKASFIPVALILVGGIIIAKTIKFSAIVYILPPIFATSLYLLLNNKKISTKQAIAIIVVTSLAVLLTLLATYDIWSPRINLSPSDYLYRLVNNPLLQTSPLTLITTALCTSYILLYQPGKYLGNVYRSSLLSIVILTPILLSAFGYSPMRYFSPIIPAYILLILEWENTRSLHTAITHSIVAKSFAIGMIAMALIAALISLHTDEYIQVRYIIVLGIIAATLFAFFIRQPAVKKGLRYSIYALIAATLVYNLIFSASLYLNQTHNAQQLRNRIAETIDEKQVIAGGWAPFLTLGTNVRSLYSNTVFNTVDTLKIIQPDYFMLSETPTATEAFKILQQDPDISTGDPVHLGVYNQTNVYLYPLQYN